MAAVVPALDELKGQRPEWQPWLAVVEEALREIGSDAWSAAVPDAPAPRDRTSPLLAGATVTIDARLVRRRLERLLRQAGASGTPPMATLAALRCDDRKALALFGASLCHDAGAIQQAAVAAGADADALQAVVALLPVAFLQACHRRWAARVHPAWSEAYCPVCGSWPAFDEVRGIERSRHHRCGRCGSEWHARPLCCVYCGMDDHHALVSLVPETAGSHAVDACRRCRGYLKAITRLQGCRPEGVMVEDLASAALDVAAIGEGYQRPGGAGAALDVTVAPAERRILRWP